MPRTLAENSGAFDVCAGGGLVTARVNARAFGRVAAAAQARPRRRSSLHCSWRTLRAASGCLRAHARGHAALTLLDVCACRTAGVDVSDVDTKFVLDTTEAGIADPLACTCGMRATVACCCCMQLLLFFWGWRALWWASRLLGLRTQASCPRCASPPMPRSRCCGLTRFVHWRVCCRCLTTRCRCADHHVEAGGRPEAEGPRVRGPG